MQSPAPDRSGEGRRRSEVAARQPNKSLGAGTGRDGTAPWIDHYVEAFLLGGLAIHLRNKRVLLALTVVTMLGTFMVSYGSTRISPWTSPRLAVSCEEQSGLCSRPLRTDAAFFQMADGGPYGIWLREWPLVVGLAVLRRAPIFRPATVFAFRCAAARPKHPSQETSGPAKPVSSGKRTDADKLRGELFPRAR